MSKFTNSRLLTLSFWGEKLQEIAVYRKTKGNWGLGQQKNIFFVKF